MKRPDALRIHPGRSFDAMVVSTKCRHRIKAFSTDRPDTLFVSCDAHIMARNGLSVAMTSQEKRLFLVIVGRRGNVASYDAIIDALWGDDANGGPEDAHRAISVLLCRLRPSALLLGFRVEAVFGQGLFAFDLFPQGRIAP